LVTLIPRESSMTIRTGTRRCRCMHGSWRGCHS